MRIYRKQIRILFFYSITIGTFLFGSILGSRTVTAISEMIPVDRKHCIVIDAGHGGEDGGAVSCRGKTESSYNLQISLRLNDLIHLLGYKTKMIRSTDDAVYTAGETIAQKKVSDLKHRVQIANQASGSILVSIHQNTFPEKQYSGAQVFYAKNQESVELAKRMQSSLISSLNPQSHREEKQGSGIYLLEKIHVPGILVECGFLSNPEEEILLSTPEYQKKLCCVISSVLARFLADA